MTTDLDAPLCERFHGAIELVGRRWTGAILFLLLGGHRRFSELAEGIPGISDRLLSERLKELEAAGIVERCPLAETPGRTEYGLTEAGQGLAPAIEALVRWAHDWLPDPDLESSEASPTQR